jgi:hypothetical protein
MLWFDRQFDTPLSSATVHVISPPAYPRFTATVLLLFCGVAVANVLTTLLLCGLGPCPDNPTNYEWLGEPHSL